MANALYATMTHSQLVSVITTVVDENVALKTMIGGESNIAKRYAELDVERRAERDMLRKAVRPLDLQKVCCDVNVLTSMGRTRTDCAAVMCGVMSLLSDVGVCLPSSMVTSRTLSLIYKPPPAKPMIFIDLCGESSDDDIEQPVMDVESVATVSSVEDEDDDGDDAEEEEEQSAAAVETDVLEPKANECLGTSCRSSAESPSEGVVQGAAHSASRVPTDVSETVKEARALYASSLEENRGSDMEDSYDWYSLGKEGQGGCVSGTEYTETECYVRAIELNPSCRYVSPNAWAAIGKSYLDGAVCVHGHTFTRAECLIKALEIDPNHALAWAFLGRSNGGVVSGRSYTKVECLTRSIEIDAKNDGEPWVGLGLEGGGIVAGKYGLRLESWAYVAGKQYSPKECFVEQLTITPNDDVTWRFLAGEGGGSVGGIEYSRVKCLGKALEINPKCVASWKRLGDLAGGLISVNGQSYTPKQCYVKAIENSTQFAEITGHAWSRLATLGGGCVNGQKYTAAQCFIAILEKYNPTSASVNELATAGLSWTQLGNFGGGNVNNAHYTKVQCLAKALEVLLNGNVPSSMTSMDMMWLDLGDGGGGCVNGKKYTKVECYARSLEINPTNGDAWRHLGDAGGGLRVGNVTFSKSQCYVKSLEVRPMCPSVWRSLASAGGGRVFGQSYTKMQCYVKAKQLDQMSEGLA